MRLVFFKNEEPSYKKSYTAYNQVTTRRYGMLLDKRIFYTNLRKLSIETKAIHFSGFHYQSPRENLGYQLP